MSKVGSVFSSAARVMDKTPVRNAVRKAIEGAREHFKKMGITLTEFSKAGKKFVGVKSGGHTIAMEVKPGNDAEVIQAAITSRLKPLPVKPTK